MTSELESSLIYGLVTMRAAIKKSYAMQNAQGTGISKKNALLDPNTVLGQEEVHNTTMENLCSYASLITFTINSSPKKKITSRFTSGFVWQWKNSIWYNLSLNKGFFKVLQSKDDPGKGNRHQSKGR
ncbi:Forkhead box protein J3 [Lemmus lemmus]